MCKILKVSESGYYRWLINRSKPTKRQTLLVEINKVIAESPENDNYGYSRMNDALLQRDIHVSDGTVYRAMKDAGLLHKCRRPHGITKATTEVQEKENIINRDFKAEKPLEKVLTDITEVQCANGKLYISAMFDCFNGEIIALEMRDNMKKELCLDTVNQLKNRYKNLNNLILHSDRGSQYTSEAFKKLLNQYGITQSLSGTGHCYDNARMESFFATLKKEKLYRIPTYRMTKDEVKTIVFRYIFTYYNRKRIYTSNPGSLAPAAYREKYEMGEIAV